MKKLTAEEFSELPEEEQRKRYVEMSDYEKFIYRTQYEPLGLGKTEKGKPISEEEREEKCKGFYEFIVREYERDIEHAKSDEEVKRLTKNMEKFKKEHNL